MRRKGGLLCVLVAVLASELSAWTNDICMPSALWMLDGVPNEVYVHPILKRWCPYDDFVRFEFKDGKGSFSRRLNRVATISGVKDGAVLEVRLVNGDEFETVKTCLSEVHVGRPGVGKDEVCVQILGDSFTHGEFFRHALLDSGWVPHARLVGLLKCGEGQYDEGRGGWSLANYFRVTRGEYETYHGYMQPDAGRYWGATAFWRMAWRCVRGSQPDGFRPKYFCSRMDDCVTRFDEKTGLLLGPRKGDIQFDNDARAMIRFDGVRWTKADEKSLSWTFDYAKYLEMWGLKRPQFLFVLLGLNDFRNDLKADFTEWGERILKVRDSYLKACPDGKFVICIPSSTCGSVDNAAGDFTPYQNAAMWRFRKWLIEWFDRRVKDGIHLLDLGIGIDNECGFRSEVKEGGRLVVQNGNPHPYPNYPRMGIPLAAFIQCFRMDK